MVRTAISAPQKICAVRSKGLQHKEDVGEGYSTARRTRGVKRAAHVRVVVADSRLRGENLRWITRPGPRALARGSVHGDQGGSLVPGASSYTRKRLSLSLSLALSLFATFKSASDVGGQGESLDGAPYISACDAEDWNLEGIML